MKKRNNRTANAIWNPWPSNRWFVDHTVKDNNQNDVQIPQIVAEKFVALMFIIATGAGTSWLVKDVDKFAARNYC